MAFEKYYLKRVRLGFPNSLIELIKTIPTIEPDSIQRTPTGLSFITFCYTHDVDNRFEEILQNLKFKQIPKLTLVDIDPDTTEMESKPGERGWFFFPVFGGKDKGRTQRDVLTAEKVEPVFLNSGNVENPNYDPETPIYQIYRSTGGFYILGNDPEAITQKLKSIFGTKVPQSNFVYYRFPIADIEKVFGPTAKTTLDFSKETAKDPNFILNLFNGKADPESTKLFNKFLTNNPNTAILFVDIYAKPKFSDQKELYYEIEQYIGRFDKSTFNFIPSGKNIVGNAAALAFELKTRSSLELFNSNDLDAFVEDKNLLKLPNRMILGDYETAEGEMSSDNGMLKPELVKSLGDALEKLDITKNEQFKRIISSLIAAKEDQKEKATKDKNYLEIAREDGTILSISEDNLYLLTGKSIRDSIEILKGINRPLGKSEKLSDLIGKVGLSPSEEQLQIQQADKEQEALIKKTEDLAKQQRQRDQNLSDFKDFLGGSYPKNMENIPKLMNEFYGFLRGRGVEPEPFESGKGMNFSPELIDEFINQKRNEIRSASEYYEAVLSDEFNKIKHKIAQTYETEEADTTPEGEIKDPAEIDEELSISREDASSIEFIVKRGIELSNNSLLTAKVTISMVQHPNRLVNSSKINQFLTVNTYNESFATPQKDYVYSMPLEPKDPGKYLIDSLISVEGRTAMLDAAYKVYHERRDMLIMTGEDERTEEKKMIFPAALELDTVDVNQPITKYGRMKVLFSNAIKVRRESTTGKV